MTIAQQLKITKFPFIIKDDNGNQIYYENSTGSWYKSEYNSQGKEIYYERSNGYWCKREYNLQGKEIYYENSEGYWDKREYNSQGEEIYYESSTGTIVDNRPKVTEFTMDEIATKLGIPVEQLKIKK